MTCSLLWEHLTYLKSKDIPIASTLFLQVDNCWRDNKNLTVLRFLGYLIHLNIFDNVYLSSLPPGHTHEDIDQKFSVISRKLQITSLFSPLGWTSFIEKTFASLIQSGWKIFGTSVTGIWNFKEFFETNTTDISGHSTARYFHIYKVHSQHSYVGMKLKKRLSDSWEGLATIGPNSTTPIALFYPHPPETKELNMVKKKPIVENWFEAAMSEEAKERMSEADNNYWLNLVDSIDASETIRPFDWSNLVPEEDEEDEEMLLPEIHINEDSTNSDTPLSRSRVNVNLHQQFVLSPECVRDSFVTFKVTVNIHNSNQMESVRTEINFVVGKVVEVFPLSQTVKVAVFNCTRGNYRRSDTEQTISASVILVYFKSLTKKNTLPMRILKKSEELLL